MTSREAARQSAEAIERLAHEVAQARDPYQAAHLVANMQQETRRLGEEMLRIREEERQQQPA